jgi:ABC-type dipeptide/oligopeptide/nickel transport system ATPase component
MSQQIAPRGITPDPAIRAPESELLEVRNLRTHFFTSDGLVRAVDGVDLTVRRGRTLGLVGESGCGKTVTALSIMRLVPSPPGRIVGGQILLEGQDLTRRGDAEIDRVRGGRIAMIFQEPPWRWPAGRCC